MKYPIVVILIVLWLFRSPSAPSQAAGVTPFEESDDIEWTPEELAMDVAQRDRPAKVGLGHTRILLNKAETPHVHDMDLTILLRDGEVRLHWSGQQRTLRAGEVAMIPAGIEHWAENIGTIPAEAYAIFTPPPDLDAAPGESDPQLDLVDIPSQPLS